MLSTTIELLIGVSDAIIVYFPELLSGYVWAYAQTSVIPDKPSTKYVTLS
jgi:hypothetical protein